MDWQVKWETHAIAYYSPSNNNISFMSKIVIQSSCCTHNNISNHLPFTRDTLAKNNIANEMVYWCHMQRLLQLFSHLPRLLLLLLPPFCCALGGVIPKKLSLSTFYQESCEKHTYKQREGMRDVHSIHFPCSHIVRVVCSGCSYVWMYWNMSVFVSSHVRNWWFSNANGPISKREHFKSGFSNMILLNTKHDFLSHWK